MVELPENESHHASRVLRCTQGESIVLFDGVGNEALGTIESIDKRSVRVAITSRQFAPRAHDGRLHFAVALPKGDRQRNTIEKLVELGVDSLCPLITKRSVAVVNENNAERLERYVIEACKQCGRNQLMSIEPSASIDVVMSAHLSSTWILHPEPLADSSHSIHAANRFAADHPPISLLFLIGPEGGFTEEEVAQAIQLGAKILSLGERIQRVETAVATAAVLGHCWLPLSR